MNNYFILHGSYGSCFGNWFPWLYNEIENRKDKSISENICYVPQFPTGRSYQNYDNWEKVMLSYVSSNLINENTIIFAHSIAPIFVCKFLIKHKIIVKRLVFVCGFNNFVIDGADDYNYVNKTMFCENFEEVKNYCNDIICFYSDNDPYVSFEAEDDFAKKVSNERHVINGGGHLNGESGCYKFEEILKYIG